MNVHHQLYNLLKKKRIIAFLQCAVVPISSDAELCFRPVILVLTGGCLFLPSLLITFLVLKSFSFPYFEQNFSVVVYAVTLYKLDVKMHICSILARFCYC